MPSGWIPFWHNYTLLFGILTIFFISISFVLIILILILNNKVHAPGNTIPNKHSLFGRPLGPREWTQLHAKFTRRKGMPIK
jgi:preprotein translocase subunit SecG